MPTTAATAWRFDRVLKASYWNVYVLVTWIAQDLIATLPAPFEQGHFSWAPP